MLSRMCGWLQCFISWDVAAGDKSLLGTMKSLSSHSFLYTPANIQFWTCTPWSPPHRLFSNTRGWIPDKKPFTKNILRRLLLKVKPVLTEMVTWEHRDTLTHISFPLAFVCLSCQWQNDSVFISVCEVIHCSTSLFFLIIRHPTSVQHVHNWWTFLSIFIFLKISCTLFSPLKLLLCFFLVTIQRVISRAG